MKYRKKPVVIEAMQFIGGNLKDCLEFIGDKARYDQDCCAIVIKTLEGEMLAMGDDWIIKGVNGEFYPCEPDIFKKTYELVKI